MTQEELNNYEDNDEQAKYERALNKHKELVESLKEESIDFKMNVLMNSICSIAIEENINLSVLHQNLNSVFETRLTIEINRLRKIENPEKFKEKEEKEQNHLNHDIKGMKVN